MRPLTQLTDDELQLELERLAQPVDPSYSDIMAEMDRRREREDARKERRIVMVSVAIAAMAAAASMVAAIASLANM